MMSRIPEDNLDAEMDQFRERGFGDDSQSMKLPWVVWLLAAIPMALVLLGLYCTYAGGVRVATAFEAANWPTVDGIVTICEVSEYVEGSDRTFSETYTRYEANLVYEYTVNGTLYDSERIAIGETSVRGIGEATRRLSPYAVGETVTVFYDSADPGKSCFVNGATRSAYMLLLGGLVMVLLTARIILGWMRESAQSHRRNARRANT